MSQRRTVDLHGILVAVTTPFTPDGDAVDEVTLRAQTERLVAAGVHGLVTTGSTGEFSTLTPQEYRRTIEAYVEATAHRIPVIAGVGALATRDAIALAQHAEQVGADAVMLLPPFYGGLTWDGLTTFLRDVTSAICIPAMYYNIPGHTGTRLTAAQLAALGEIPGLDFVKDTSGDAACQAELLAARTDTIQVFNGYDTLTFHGLAAGARAAVWGAAGIVPELAVEFWDTLAVKGDLVTAREQWKHLWAISDFLESVDYAAGIKAGLDLTGHSTGPVRKPLLPLGSEQVERFRGILATAGRPA